MKTFNKGGHSTATRGSVQDLLVLDLLSATVVGMDMRSGEFGSRSGCALQCSRKVRSNGETLEHTSQSTSGHVWLVRLSLCSQRSLSLLSERVQD